MASVRVRSTMAAIAISDPKLAARPQPYAELKRRVEAAGLLRRAGAGQDRYRALDREPSSGPILSVALRPRVDDACLERAVPRQDKREPALGRGGRPLHARGGLPAAPCRHRRALAHASGDRDPEMCRRVLLGFCLRPQPQGHAADRIGPRARLPALAGPDITQRQVQSPHRPPIWIAQLSDRAPSFSDHAPLQHPTRSQDRARLLRRARHSVSRDNDLPLVSGDPELPARRRGTTQAVACLSTSEATTNLGVRHVDSYREKKAG